jgi:hypothetical protein
MTLFAAKQENLLHGVMQYGLDAIRSLMLTKPGKLRCRALRMFLLCCRNLNGTMNNKNIRVYLH